MFNMSPSVKLKATLLPNATIWRKQGKKNVHLLQVFYASWVLHGASFWPLYISFGMNGTDWNVFVKGTGKFSQTAGLGEMPVILPQREPARKEDNFPNYTSLLESWHTGKCMCSRGSRFKFGPFPLSLSQLICLVKQTYMNKMSYRFCR